VTSCDRHGARVTSSCRSKSATSTPHLHRDSLCVRMGGRVAELLVYGDLSTGAANDLVGNTELAARWSVSGA